MSAHTIWSEKYRPKTVDEYVFQDSKQREIVSGWVKEKTIPHLLLSGSPGTGKTTLAKVLINELGVDDFDTLSINASRDNGVDHIRHTIERFVSTMPFGDFKVVLLDESDYLSPSAQAVLRGLMETYSASSRFILTCNYPNKIIPALHSRCQGFHITRIDNVEFTARAAKILLSEDVDFDIDVLDTYIRATYPDLRKCTNLLQVNCANKKLFAPAEQDQAQGDYKIDMVALLKAGKIREARKLLCSQVRADEIEDVFRWAYDNLDLWSQTPQGQDKAILIIRNALVNIPLCADQEINLSAMLVELSEIDEE
jgi:replication factor C small subunit